jgi:hypothetical protein
MYVKPDGLQIDIIQRLFEFESGEAPHGYPYQTTRRDIGLSIAAPNSCIETQSFMDR